jgi:hypothetical protein
MFLRLAPRLIKSKKNTSEVITHDEAVAWLEVSQRGGPGGIPE